MAKGNKIHNYNYDMQVKIFLTSSLLFL